MENADPRESAFGVVVNLNISMPIRCLSGVVVANKFYCGTDIGFVTLVLMIFDQR